MKSVKKRVLKAIAGYRRFLRSLSREISLVGICM